MPLLFLDSSVAGTNSKKRRDASRWLLQQGWVNPRARRYRVRRAAGANSTSNGRVASRRALGPDVASLVTRKSKNARANVGDVCTQGVCCLRSSFRFLFRWDAPYTDACRVQVQHIQACLCPLDKTCRWIQMWHRCSPAQLFLFEFSTIWLSLFHSIFVSFCFIRPLIVNEHARRVWATKNIIHPVEYTNDIYYFLNLIMILI